jgi:hypothetical protein
LAPGRPGAVLRNAGPGKVPPGVAFPPVPRPDGFHFTKCFRLQGVNG